MNSTISEFDNSSIEHPECTDLSDDEKAVLEQFDNV